MDRIFLDSQNTRAARRASTTSNENKIRKNKRLSDNVPTAPDAVFDAEGDGGRGARDVVKCAQVVRKKRERELLTAYVCDECQTFYDAMMPNKDRATIKCAHAPRARGDVGGLAPENSRHRARWAPEPAPRGFWNLAFTPPERDA